MVEPFLRVVQFRRSGAIVSGLLPIRIGDISCPSVGRPIEGRRSGGEGEADESERVQAHEV